MSDVRERILVRLKDLGISPRAGSLASGMSATAIRDLFRRPDNSPTMETIAKLAVGLQTTPGWLAYGAVSDVDDRASALSPPAKLSPFVQAQYGGTVEAGTFRPVDDFDDDPGRDPTFVPRDPQFPQARLFIFDVAGDSMNALKPNPIPPGCRLLCVSIEKLRLPLRDNMVVIVEQTINGGHLRERSVKQVREFDDRYEFCPRSRNVRHTPIVVRKDKEADDGRTVAVIAVVREILNSVPLG